MRDRSIDVGRGILVLMMVYGHVMQFFGDGALFPAVNTLIEIINVTVFPTFVFYFGATAVHAYLNKPYWKALPRMAKTALRAYAAFCLSGVGFRVLRENKPLAVGTVRRVLQLADVPGWSEFLIAFALYSLLLIVGFAAFVWLAERPKAALAAGALCVCCCLIPYGAVKPTQLALLIGGTNFSYFPIVQYMPYLLAGMVYAKGTAKAWHFLMLAAICSTVGMGYWYIAGFPGRFPPTWGWIVLSATPAALVVLLGRILCALSGNGLRQVADWLCSALAQLGGASLYYLLTSNLVLFTLAGKNVLPMMARKSVLPWRRRFKRRRVRLCGRWCWYCAFGL